MWKKKDEDVEGAQPHSVSTQQSDAARLLGDALSQSPSMNDDFEKRDLAVPSEKGVAAVASQTSTSPNMNTYTEAVKEFTTNATALIEHLPLFTKARAAYEEAMRASAEMRKVLDTSDENLRNLMAQLEQQVNVRDLKAATDRKPPETARVERMKGIEEGGNRASRWP